MVIERPVGSGVLVAAGLVLLGLCASCGGGGGGGGGTPEVSFSFASAAATMQESDGPTNVTVVLHTSLPALDEDVTVQVADAATGTATSGSDYAAFAPVTITFPTGAVEGATQTVALDPLDDSLVEGGSETVRLQLQNPSRGGVAGPSAFTATLTDIHTAYVGFAVANETMKEASAGSLSIALELDCGPCVTLGVPVSVRVSDLGTGTASSGSDYVSFSPKTVTFPAGSVDGGVQTATLTVSDDIIVENQETVELGLSQPSSACVLGATVVNVLTIADDDISGTPAFVASEGSTGTENPLTYDELVSLGTQTVGAGPNAGTLVRVTNAGGGVMNLGAPSLAGNNPNDFTVEIDSSSMPVGAPESSLPLFAPPARAGRSLAVDGPGMALRLDASALENIASLQRVDLHALPLPDLGPVTVELERRPLPLTADAKLVIDGREVAGGVRTLVGDLQIWRGVVAGMPGSRVYLALSASGARGFIELPFLQDRFVHVLTDGAGEVRLVREQDLEGLGLQAPRDFCAGERFVPGQPMRQPLSDPGAPPTSALTVTDCRLAVETDTQFFQKFGSSAALTNYVTSLVGAVSDQYFTDVQTTLSIAYLGVHTCSDDGWSTQETPGADAGDLLDEFQADWGSSWPGQANTADIAHFLSGDSLGGGIAYVDVLCNHSFGFGVSANLSGTINWSTWTGLPGGFTWDFVVVAHEIGHNFGAQHTHSYCPPLDHCYTNCDATTSCTRGTLMSYCHVNCGGLANIDLYFHPVNANVMRQRVNASCLDDAALLPGNFIQYRVRFNPLTTTGSRSATLNYTHDAANVTQPFRVRLAGTAN
jgi:hypothetical protein